MTGARAAVVIAAMVAGCAAESVPADPAPSYLLFQLFTFAPSPDGRTTPFDKQQLDGILDNIVTTLGAAHGDGKARQLGFSIGPLALDHTDDEMRSQIDAAFELAEHKDLAVAIHIDDSMFWMRRSDLWSNTDNVEWTDWNRTVKPHLTIGWAPTTLAPKMCYESPAVRAEIKRIARDVIGAEVKQRVDRLRSLGKAHLFAGVIAGWETRMQDDTQPPVKVGYCSLHHLGYTAASAPAALDAALDEIVHDWAELWVESLAAAGLPASKLYTHIAITTMPESINAPASTAFNAASRPGFSVYPVEGTFAALYAGLAAQADSPWAMAEGTNGFPSGPVETLAWDTYLAKLYNHGAAVVNIFAWQDPGSLGTATRSSEALAAYAKFLAGEPLVE